MPEIHADTIAEVILLSRAMGESTAVGARDGIRHSGEAGSVAEQQFRAFISGMTEEQQYSLVAVMWIGRDSFSADEYDEAYMTARQEASQKTEDYLIGVPMLADYLENGLEALGVSPGEAEGGLL